MKFHHLKGKRIKKACLNPWPDGRGGKAYSPHIVFEDGTILRFVVQETETGEYGVEPIIVKGGICDSPSDCPSCRGYGHFDEAGEPTIDKRCRMCLDCTGTGVKP